MNNKTLRGLLQGAEVGITVLLLFLADYIDLPFPNLRSTINLITYIFVVIVAIPQYKKIAYVITRDISLILLVILAFISILWSVDISLTLEDIKGLARTTLFGAYLATRYSMSQQRRIFFSVAIIALVLNLIVFIVFPSYAIDPYISGTWKGIYEFKQFLGRAMSLTSSFFIVNLLAKKSNRWFSLIGLFSSITLLLLSGSKTNLIVVIILILLMPIYTIAKQQLSYQLILIFIILTIFATLGYLVLINLQTIVVDTLGKDIEFNGRTPIWDLAIEKLMERPWLGYGYSAFWASESGQFIIQHTWGIHLQQQVGNLTRWHAHNTFLEISLELGLVGGTLLALNVIIVLQRVFRLLRLTKTIDTFWMFEFLVFQLVYNLTEIPTYLATFAMYWIIYVAIACSSAVELNRFRRNRQLSTFVSNV